MIHWKLATHTITKNREQYLPFILASTILVAVNYIFWSTTLNNSLKRTINGQVTVELMFLGTIFITLVSVIFMLYINRFLIKQEINELALYNMLGFAVKDLKRILLIQIIILFLISISLGLVTGVTFGKIFFLILNALIQSSPIVEQFQVTSFILVILIFGGIFLLAFVSDIKSIYKVNPANLWQQGQKAESEPQENLLGGIIGLCLLAWGYWIAIRTQPNMKSMFRFLFAIIIVVLGTYMFFIFSSIVFLKLLKKQKRFYYQPNHFISVSGMLYRMKQNGASLASICLLCTAVLVAVVGTMSLYVGQEHLINNWSPYDFVISKKTPVSQTDYKLLDQTAAEQHVQIKANKHLVVTTPVPISIKNTRITTGFKGASHQMSTLTVDNYNQLEKTKYHLSPNEVLIYSEDQPTLPKKLFINGQEYKTRVISCFHFSFSYQNSALKPLFIITADQKAARNINPHSWLYVLGFNTRGNTKQVDKFAAKLPVVLRLKPDNYSAIPIIKKAIHALCGSLLFIGGLISLTMILVTALLIYYKQISEGYADRERFQTMQEVGLSFHETKQAIRSQVLTLFMFPIIGAVVNLMFAFPAIKNSLSLFSMYNFRLLVVVALVTFLLLLTYYLVIYGLTTRIYTKIVEQRVHNLE